jgi:hypothetical protein
LSGTTSSIKIWSENSSPKSEAKMAEIEELLDVSSSPFLLFLSVTFLLRIYERCYVWKLLYYTKDM